MLSLMMALALSMAGCGGGGGSSSNNNGSGGNTPPSNTTLATITGSIRDTSPAHSPVVGAIVTVVVTGGSNRTAVTNASGTFILTNVPLTTASFTVAAPSGGAYYNYANYHGNYYDLSACSLQLPTLVAGANAPYTEIDMYVGGSNPPPPPPIGGCPS
jgi:hypothetical protein